ncbi:MAG: ADOP family duplicated permease [Gemmatimonadales bacterium]
MWRPDKYQPLNEALQRGDVDPEVGEELESHLAMRIEANLAAGMSRPEAEGEARRRFGDLDRYRRETKAVEQAVRTEGRRRERFDLARQEIRRAIRSLRKAPTFTIAALVTLGLGLGAATAIFAILDAVVLRPLPYPDDGRLVRIYHPVPKNREGDRWNISTAEFYHFRAEAKSLESVGLYGHDRLTVMAGGQGLQVKAAIVTTSTLGLLGARPVHGRLLTMADSEERGPMSVVLGESFWRRQLGASPDVVGTTMRIEGTDGVVVGVVADGADLPDWKADLWLATRLDPRAPARNNHTSWAIARLTPGATVEDASAELAAMVGSYPERFPTAYDQAFLDRTGFTTVVVRWKDDVIGDSGRILWLLFGAVGVVLLIVCFNVGNLFVVRSQLMRRESAVRSALGADRQQLAWHHLAESGLITLAALVAGLGLARLGLAVFVGVVADAGGADGQLSIPRLSDAALGWSGFGFAVVIAGVVGGLMTLGPLLVGPAPNAVLRQGSRGLTASRRDARLRAGLVVGQITFAVVLLSAGGLMLRTFQNLRRVEPGFDPGNVAAVDVALPYNQYQTYPRTTAFYRRLVDEVGALTVVRHAAVASDLPIEGGDGCSVLDYPDRPDNVDVSCIANVVVGPEFFTTLGIPLEGRDLAWSDLDAKSGGALVTDALATRLWGTGAGIDRGINGPNPRTNPPYRVVGLTRSLRWRGLDREPTEVAFLPLEPIPGTWLWSPPARMILVVKLDGAGPTSIFPELERIVAGIDPEVAVTNPRAMEDVVARSLFRVRLIMGLMLLSSAVALLLSVVGLYGVVAHLVSRRTQEFGLRIALGSSIGRVRALVVNESVRLALAGVAVGLVGAVLLTRSMRSLLYGVSPNDPVALGAAAGVLLVVAVVASLGPAIRATRIDPIEALRAE